MAVAGYTIDWLQREKASLQRSIEQNDQKASRLQGELNAAAQDNRNLERRIADIDLLIDLGKARP